MVPPMTEAEIRQNLVDAGCGPETVDRYMAARAAGDGRQCRRLLEEWRRSLLEEIHQGQKRLDRLDHLRYQLQKNGEENMV